jgi:hypothetical protein
MSGGVGLEKVAELPYFPNPKPGRVSRGPSSCFHLSCSARFFFLSLFLVYLSFTLISAVSYVDPFPFPSSLSLPLKSPTNWLGLIFRLFKPSGAWDYGSQSATFFAKLPPPPHSSPFLHAVLSLHILLFSILYSIYCRIEKIDKLTCCYV